MPELPPQFALARMMTGYAVSQLIYIGAKLGLADLLQQGPQSINELANNTKTHQDSLNRVMRCLVALGLFKQNESGQFELAALGQFLRTDVPDSLAEMSLFSEESYLAWGHLLHSVETGETAFKRVFGMHRYQYLEQHPEAAARFNAAMARLSSQLAAAVVSAYDFSRFETAVDIGGGQGGLLLAVLRANPTLGAILFDTSSVVDVREEQLEGTGIAGRCKLVAGDFFESVPAGGDVYLLSHVIHNWDDDHCIRILKNCRKAIGPEGRLLIIEMIVPTEFAPSFSTYPLVMTDLQMLVMTGGRERTESEFGTLLAAAGFKLERVVPTQALDSVIECIPLV
jgi:ubiquinone/menaquinone biosynthesis C-methylase UbiE